MLKRRRQAVTFVTSTARSKRSVVTVMSIKQVRPLNGNDHHRKGSPRLVVVCIALATLISAIPSPAETLSTPTRLSLSPLPSPTAATTVTNHFSLAIAPRPKSDTTTNGIAAGSSHATRRVLAAAAYLNQPSGSAKRANAGLFSTQVGERGFGIAGIQAGYGMAFMDEVFTRGRNGTAMQEPSYIVVKTSLKF
jgi:hypothetical protein